MASDLDECTLRLDSLGLEIPAWTSLTVHSDFLTPSDGWNFVVGDPDLPQGIAGKLREGAKVSVTVGDTVITTGFIDEIHYESTRGSGTTITISGTDVLGDSLFSTVDPTAVFLPTETLGQIVQRVMAPYGFPDAPLIDNDDNRDLVSGNLYGFKVYGASKRGKSSGRKRKRKSKGKSRSRAGQAVDAFTNYQAKPHPSEGAYEFCARLAARNGLRIWATGDGKKLVIGKPEFDQEPSFKLIRRRGNAGADNNVISGSVNRSRTNQPSVIVAAGTGGGGNFSRATLKVVAINELISRQVDGSLIPDVQAIIDKYPKAYVLGPSDFEGFVSPLALNPYPRAKPLYLHDAEARDLEQLKNFALRELANRQKQSLSMHYTVEGHTQAGAVWAKDTIVDVLDEVADISEPMWIQSVTFTKSRGAGTRCEIVAIRPWTMVF